MPALFGFKLNDAGSFTNVDVLDSTSRTRFGRLRAGTDPIDGTNSIRNNTIGISLATSGANQGRITVAGIGASNTTVDVTKSNLGLSYDDGATVGATVGTNFFKSGTTTNYATNEFQNEETEFTVRYRQTYPAPYELVAEPSISGEILFMSDRDGDWDLYTVNGDGTGLNQITDNDVDDWSGVYSPDGTKIAFDAKHGTAPGDIFVVDADGANQKNLTSSFSEDAFATWSPDGKQIGLLENKKVYLIII